MTDAELISEIAVANGVEALKACVAKLKDQKKDLFALGDTEYIFLQFSFKKISLQRQTTKIVLPHSLVDETTAVCLFVTDVDRGDRDYSITVDKYRELLDQAGIKPQIDIVPLKQLKLEYKEYESKRNLLAMYDMFLADARIVRLLPSHLGRHFFKRKRFPLQVNMTCRDLTKEMSKALTTSCCVLAGRGSSGQMTVGKLSQTTEQVTENILCSVGKMASSLPGGWNNIRSLHIKAQDTPSVPIYVSFGLKDDVELPQRKRVKVEQEPEEVSTVVSGKVVVSAMGSARIVGRNKDASELKTDQKLVSKTEKNSVTKKGHALQKTKSSCSAKPEFSKVVALKRNKATKQRKETGLKTSESLKQSVSQQPPMKKKRSV